MEKEKPMNPLFAEFPPVSKDQWKAEVIKDLKGAGFEKLIWKTYEGLDIQPFYTREDLTHLDYLKGFENIPGDPKSPVRKWENKEKIVATNEKQANELAMEALHGGADGLAFEISNSGSTDFETLLKGVNLADTPATFIIKGAAVAFQRSFIDWLGKKNFPLKDLKGGIQYDPAVDYAVTGAFDEKGIADLAEITKAFKTSPDFYTITVNAGAFKDAGGAATQELAFALSAAAHYFDKLMDNGLTAGEIAKKMQFSLAMGVDYFIEIAKLKALRILFLQVAKAFGAHEFQAGDLQIHCYSSLWSRTVFDPSVNLLRDTTAAMSAILGGCNSLTIEPYDSIYKNQQPFLRRIARNISTIAREESYLDKVVDPTAGSYYIGNLIHELGKVSWSLFQETESQGGFIEAFKKGWIQEKIKSVREARKNKIAGRRDIIVGVNQYPNIQETVNPDHVKIEENGAAANVEILKPQRAATDFEEMRLATEKFARKTGKKPSVYLLEYGTNVAMRKARSAFSMGFFGTAGFNVVEGIFATDIASAIDKVKNIKAEIVVLCSSDDDYAAMGEEFARQFKANLRDKQLVLAGYPAEIVDKLKSAGFDEFIHIRSNAIETLKGFQKKLNII